MFSLRQNLFLLLLIGLMLLGMGFFDQFADARVIVPPEAIAQRVKAYVQQTTELSSPDETLIVELIKLPDKPIELEGETLEVFVEDHRVTPIPWHTIVSVVFTTEAGREQIGVPIKVQVEKSVWVAKKLIRAKSALTHADVSQQRRRLGHEYDYAVAADETISEYATAINISPGQVLDIRQVKKKPAVANQQAVTILMKAHGGVNIKMSGTALQDGAVGDTIKVSQTTRDHKTKIYTGQVIKNRLVLVKL
ncbi:MAG: flagellar basal body P-ring formation protein FlgA [Cyanobacteria bacterium HKST-UBA05]|nr:flagellar basal body P-ring formation protein FlgA [Cyanobacteria bacterium HKST-UBA05]